jgi:hypothetical protein
MAVGRLASLAMGALTGLALDRRRSRRLALAGRGAQPEGEGRMGLDARPRTKDADVVAGRGPRRWRV